MATQQNDMLAEIVSRINDNAANFANTGYYPYDLPTAKIKENIALVADGDEPEWQSRAGGCYANTYNVSVFLYIKKREMEDTNSRILWANQMQMQVIDAIFKDDINLDGEGGCYEIVMDSIEKGDYVKDEFDKTQPGFYNSTIVRKINFVLTWKYHIT